tara:strand:- start:1315 stop:1572 length:258 start_codon:yes stop_codon:yes gene_type:complete
MSSEIHKYNEASLKKKENFFNAKLIDFPGNKNMEATKNLSEKHYYTWKLYDKSNDKEDGDQLRTVIGICFMFGVLILTGLYSTLI